jgi:outer membrane protein assembly factor BamE
MSRHRYAAQGHCLDRKTRLRRQGARALATLAALASICSLNACVYRMPIQQGNYLDPVVIAQVKTGMTHSQVRYLLGTPMVPGAFDTSRWDYDYYLKNRRLKGPGRGHVAIYFTDNLVARVDSNVTEAPFASISERNAQAPEPRSGGGH